MLAKILVIDERFQRRFARLAEDWPAPEHDVVFPAGWDVEDLRPLLADAEAIITVFRPVERSLLEMAPRLKVICRPGAGVDNVDVGAATERGVAVTNVVGTRGRSVAEHAWFLLLHLARKGWLQRDPSRWQVIDADLLQGKSLGVLGFGDIGRTVARIGHGFGMRIACHTRTPDASRAPDVAVEFVDLDACARRSDVLVLCLPLTGQTRGLVDARFLALMPPGSYLINVARGGIVVTQDLAEALQRGRLAGAGLDVTDPEPLPSDHPLRRLPNVVISPHVAGRTVQTQAAALEVVRASLLSLLEGREPERGRVVNPEVLAH